MSLSAVRKIALSGFLFPRHTMPMLTQPVRSRIADPPGPHRIPDYHEVCGWQKASGLNANSMHLVLRTTVTDRPDLLDVLRAPRRDGYGKEVDQTHAKRPRDWWNTV